MVKFKDGKQVFSVGDVVKLVNLDGLYPSQNYGDNVRLELGETYPVVEVDGDLIRVMKSNGEVEGCYPYRVELVAEEQTAEGLKNTIFSIRQEREQILSKLKGLDTQEAEAISQLNALGFSLFEQEVNTAPLETVLYAEDIEEDTTDPKNWKVGDVLEYQQSGELYVVIFKSDDRIDYKEQRGGAFTGGWMPLVSEKDIGWLKNHYKFHSRPVK